ncbi:autophagy protein Atg22 [Coniochaeta sp. 2T2.1]|nr:autophagy protein Atg22 [Coniochaeta sp. 2T2.1]
MAPRVEPPPRPPPAPRLFSRISQLSKKSFRSHSSSFEADDERSSNDDDIMTETSLDEDRRAPPRYPGEDTRPTSDKEIKGWYAYAFAAEVYVICGIGSFIPILLETLARENGVLLSDKTTPCGSSSDKNAGDGQCVVYVLGMEINTASFAMYTFSASVFLQALIVVSISCAADHGNLRKKMLLAFAWIGSASVMLYIFINKDVYVLGALLAIISNTAFGASFVLLNSFLPLLVRNHPLVEYVDKTRAEHHDPTLDDGDSEHMVDSTVALLADDVLTGHPQLQRIPTHEDVTSLELTLSSQISSKGVGIGYMAGLFLQIVAISILFAKNTEWSLRIVLFIIGCWWALFTIPAALWLRPRPGPPLPASSTKQKALAWLHYTLYAWKSLFRTIRLARRLIDIVLFLAGWFLLSDAIATTSSTAILFAKTQLHMKPWALGLINVISTAFGVAGALTWAFISRHLNLRPHQTILACIALFELIPLYGLLGYLPFVKRWGVIGLQQPWEMYPLAAVYGFVLGGLSGYCRSLYGELIPPGSEAAFYALYAITDKGSSVFGPAIVGYIIDRSGEIRPAFWFLGAIVGLPAVFIWFVNADRGKREGILLAEEIEGWKRDREAEAEDGEAEGMLGAEGGYGSGRGQDDG